MDAELRQIQKRLGLTFVLVTHNQGEAMALSDRLVVMSKGEVAQVGTGRHIYQAPATRFVANFLGEANLVPLANVGDERGEDADGVVLLSGAKGRSGNATLCNDGVPVATAARNRSVDFTDSGLATQDVELGWQLQCEVAREVAAEGIAPDALVLTHQRGTFAPADSAGRALGPHIMWMDRRGLPIVAELVKRFGDGFYDRFLLPAMPYTGLSKMLWLERNRAGAPLYLPAHAIHAVRTTGGVPVCDPSTASFMGPWDIRNSRWDTEFCGLVGLPSEKLPAMVPATTIVGELSRAAAAELGLKLGVAVVLGAADGQAAAVGCGCTEPGVMMINVGTASRRRDGARRSPLHRAHLVAHPSRNAAPFRHGTAKLGRFASSVHWRRSASGVSDRTRSSPASARAPRQASGKAGSGAALLSIPARPAPMPRRSAPRACPSSRFMVEQYGLAG